MANSGQWVLVGLLVALWGGGRAETTKGALRVVKEDKVSESEGMLEFYGCDDDDDCSWEPICDTLWDDADASTACRQMGQPSSTATAVVQAAEEFKVSYVGDGTLSWRKNVECGGNEGALVHCPADAGTFSCGKKVAGVRCGGIEGYMHWWTIVGIVGVVVVAGVLACCIVRLREVCLESKASAANAPPKTPTSQAPQTPKSGASGGSGAKDDSPPDVELRRGKRARDESARVVADFHSDITVDTAAKRAVKDVLDRLRWDRESHIENPEPRVDDTTVGDGMSSRAPTIPSMIVGPGLDPERGVKPGAGGRRRPTKIGSGTKLLRKSSSRKGAASSTKSKRKKKKKKPPAE